MPRITFFSLLVITFCLSACHTTSNDRVTKNTSDLDSIRNQFASCWKPADKITAVRVMLKLKVDGTITEAFLTPDQNSSYKNNNRFRAAADSAMRAAHKCSPIKNLPPEKYDFWRTMELNFNPQDLL